MYYNKSLVCCCEFQYGFQYTIWIAHDLHFLFFVYMLLYLTLNVGLLQCLLHKATAQWMTFPLRCLFLWWIRSVKKNNVVFELRLSYSMLPNNVCYSSNICVMQRCTEEQNCGGKRSAHMALHLTLFTDCQWHKKGLVRNKKQQPYLKPFPGANQWF